MDEDVDPSIVEYFGGDDGHKCGYCKTKKSNFSHGMWAHTMNCEDYQSLIDRGWRRSGSYCYKSVMNKTCCPLYTIRCNAVDFKLNHSHKKVLKKVNKFLRQGRGQAEGAQVLTEQPATSDDNGPMESEVVPLKPRKKLEEADLTVESAADGVNTWKIPSKKAKVRRMEQKLEKAANREAQPKKAKGIVKSLEDFLQENSGQSVKHQLEIKLVNVNSPEFQVTLKETHSLYVKYQMAIHHDEPDHCTLEQFTRFLVKSPLKWQTDVGPPMGCGSFHQQYWLDGKLIGVGVIDILPRCLSSVYFFYDPDYHFLSLGTYASLREIAFTRELSQHCPVLCWYYLGFYIHTCPKMRYKGQYKPSWLLCPESYTWQTIAECLPKLDRIKYLKLCETSDEDEDGKVDLPEVGVLYRRQAMTYAIYAAVKKRVSDQDEVQEYASLVGKKTARRMLLYRTS